MKGEFFMFNIPMNSKSALSLDSLGSAPSLSNPAPQPQFNNPTPQYTPPTPQPQYIPPTPQPQYTVPTPQPQFNSKPMPSGNGVILKKGQKTSLTKISPNLSNIRVGLGWDVGANTSYDLDSEVFLLGANEKVIGDDWFVFYGQLTSPDGAVVHHGDNSTGMGDGDDEIIDINLNQLNPQVAKLVFVVTINEARENGYNFGQIQNAYIRVTDKNTGNELVRFSLSEYYKEVVSMVVGELYLKGGEWRFNPVGMGTGDDLEGLCIKYGVNVAG